MSSEHESGLQVMIKMNSNYELLVQEIRGQINKTRPLTSLTKVPARRSANVAQSGEIIVKLDGFRRMNKTSNCVKCHPTKMSIRCEA